MGKLAAIAAAGLFIVFSLAACDARDFTAWATVTSVQEVEPDPLPEDPGPHEDDPRMPQPGFQVDLRLDDGETLSLEHHGERRYEAGERVRLLRDRSGALLL